MKFRLTVWLSLLALGAAFAPPAGAAPCSRAVVGYYPWYAQWGNTERLAQLPDALDYAQLTVVNYAFVDVAADGSILRLPEFDTLVASLVSRAHAQGVKVLVSLGGAGASIPGFIRCSRKYFHDNAGNAAWQENFASNLTSYILANDFDGVDFDWEFPGAVVGPEPLCEAGARDLATCAVDRAGFISLAQTVRAHFDAQPRRLYMSAAVPALAWWGLCWDGPSLTMLDWINVMDYDLHGSWSGHVGHHTQLFQPTGDTAFPDHPNGTNSVEVSIAYWNQTQGIPLDRLILGVAFYGHEYDEASAEDLYSLCATDTHHSYFFLGNSRSTGWTRSWDAEARVPYLRQDVGPGVISFDDPASLAAKVGWGMSRGVGGFMIWELTGDFDGVGRPLLDTLGGSVCGSSARLLIDDFNDVAQYTGLSRNDLWQATGDGGTMTSAAIVGGALRLAWNAPTASWNSELGPCFDGSSYRALRFDVRGVAGGESFVVDLVDRDAGCSTPRSHALPLASYVTVSTSVQQVAIPLDDFGADLRRLAAVRLYAFAPAVGTIDLDNLTLSAEVPPARLLRNIEVVDLDPLTPPLSQVMPLNPVTDLYLPDFIGGEVPSGVASLVLFALDRNSILRLAKRLPNNVEIRF